MIKTTVPVLTEEYKIVVYIGTLEELVTNGAKYLGKAPSEIRERIEGKRGVAYNGLPEGVAPLLFINVDYPMTEGIATIAHEAPHAMDYIANYVGIQDTRGEFHAHGVASVMRHTLKSIKKIRESFL